MRMSSTTNEDTDLICLVGQTADGLSCMPQTMAPDHGMQIVISGGVTQIRLTKRKRLDVSGSVLFTWCFEMGLRSQSIPLGGLPCEGD
jgi:hypothetical protein